MTERTMDDLVERLRKALADEFGLLSLHRSVQHMNHLRGLVREADDEIERLRERRPDIEQIAKAMFDAEGHVAPWGEVKAVWPDEYERWMKRGRIAIALSSPVDGERDAVVEIIKGFLRCPEIADCDPRDLDQETRKLERKARLWLKSKPAGEKD